VLKNSIEKQSMTLNASQDVNIGSPTEPVSAPELAVLHRRIRELEVEFSQERVFSLWLLQD
jgi:hypothetical protein